MPHPHATAADARSFREHGCDVHLLGTHIQPLRNWRFLEKRISSGQAFGRYISKTQALEGIKRYQENLEQLLAIPEAECPFESVHVYDVMTSSWCVSRASTPQEASPPPVS